MTRANKSPDNLFDRDFWRAMGYDGQGRDSTHAWS
jgi:hypothetical protein